MTYGPHKLVGSGLTPGIGEGMPKGILGIPADNNTPHKRVNDEACGGPNPWSNLPAEELRYAELGLVLWSSNHPSASWLRNNQVWTNTAEQWDLLSQGKRLRVRSLCSNEHGAADVVPRWIAAMQAVLSSMHTNLTILPRDTSICCRMGMTSFFKPCSHAPMQLHVSESAVAQLVCPAFFDCQHMGHVREPHFELSSNQKPPVALVVSGSPPSSASG